MSQLSRIKIKGVRAAIHGCGGIEGAAATVDKSTSQVGRWNSRTDADLPTLGDAFHLDEVAMAATGRAPILQALAAELGHACFRLPDALGGDVLVMTLAEAAKEFGDVAGAVTDALSDGECRAAERERIVTEIDEVMAKLARLRAIALGDTASSSAAVGQTGTASGSAAVGQAGAVQVIGIREGK